MHQCEEIHVFDGIAERTGRTAVFRSAKNYPACTSFRDLVRKYNLHGDGVFYLAGCWPSESRSVALDNVKWIGAEAAMRRRRRPRQVVSDDRACAVAARVGRRARRIDS